MKSNLRLLSSLATLSALAAAHGAVVLSFGTPSGVPLAALAAPALGATTTVSVFYTSTTTLTDSEVFVAFDRATTQGSSATRLDNRLGLSSPSPATGVALNMAQTNGGYGAAGPSRPYGLDILSVSATSGLLPIALMPARLFDVTLTNLGLAPGGTATLSFNLASGPIFTTNLYDGSANPVANVAGTSLVVTAPVPEPSALAALAVGAVALLRRRARR